RGKVPKARKGRAKGAIEGRYLRVRRVQPQPIFEPVEPREQLLPLSETVAKENGSLIRLQRRLTERADGGCRFLLGWEAVARAAEGGLHDEDVRLRHLRRLGRAPRAELEITGVEQSPVAVLDQDLGGAKDMPGRVERDGRRTEAVRLPELDGAKARSGAAAEAHHRRGARSCDDVVVSPDMIGMGVR